MGLIERVSESRSSRRVIEGRVIGGLPFQPWMDPLLPWGSGGPSRPSAMAYGPDKALGLAALYAGSKILADGAASMPIKTYNQASRTSRLTPYAGPTIFDNPSVLGTPFDWVFACMSSLVLQGNAWGLITGKDKYGFPKGIEWIPCDFVQVEEDQHQPFNPVYTKVYAYGREMKWFGSDKELFHVKGYAMAGRLDGISVLRAHALTILAGQEAQRYGTDWYAAGGFPPGTFQNSELEVDPTQAAEIRRMLVDTLRKREPLVYGRDWDYTPVTVPPSEAQFIDAMQLNATQIAAILDLPATRLGGRSGDSLTYATVEGNQIQVIEALRPWLIRLEHSLSTLLPSRRVIRFNTDALLKTDLKTRAEIQQIHRNIGLRTTDELRELDDLPPLPGDLGNEALPLELMVSMAQRSGALPKSMLEQVVLLIDVAGKKLEDLQAKGLTKTPEGQEFAPDPKTGQPAGPAGDPGQFYANMMNAYSRKMEEAGYPRQAQEVRDMVSRWLHPNSPPMIASGMEDLVDEVIEQRDDE